MWAKKRTAASANFQQLPDSEQTTESQQLSKIGEREKNYSLLSMNDVAVKSVMADSALKINYLRSFFVPEYFLGKYSS